MKILKLLPVFLLFTFGSFGQVYKWRSTDFSSRVTTDATNNYWKPWTEWASSGVLIVAQEQRVNVYSQTPQTYDMIESVTKDSDKDGNPIYSVMCVDESGVRCKMIWYHSAENGSYVIFEFSNLELMYKVISLN